MNPWFRKYETGDRAQMGAAWTDAGERRIMEGEAWSAVLDGEPVLSGGVLPGGCVWIAPGEWARTRPVWSVRTLAAFAVELRQMRLGRLWAEILATDTRARRLAEFFGFTDAGPGRTGTRNYTLEA